MNKCEEAVKYYISVLDEVTCKRWRNKPDHVAQKMIEAEKEMQEQKETTPSFSEVVSHWVSVNERLPSSNIKVLTCQRNGNIATGYYTTFSNRWLLGIESIDYSKFNPITHWMPLPKEPNV